jgi:DNA-directed RNA polymerase specialized sigma24 family protein
MARERHADLSAELIARVRAFVTYLAPRMVAGIDAQRVEDLAQESLCELTKADLDGRDPWPLAVVICRRVLNDEHKRVERRDRIAPVSFTDSLGLERATARGVVDGLADAVIDRLALAEAMATVSESRRALLADLADGKSYEAIAAERTTSVGAVRTDASRARAAIRRVWPKLGDGSLVAWWRTQAERAAAVLREVGAWPAVVPAVDRVVSAAAAVVAAVFLALAPAKPSPSVVATSGERRVGASPAPGAVATEARARAATTSTTAPTRHGAGVVVATGRCPSPAVVARQGKGQPFLCVGGGRGWPL